MLLTCGGSTERLCKFTDFVQVCHPIVFRLHSLSGGGGGGGGGGRACIWLVLILANFS